MANFYFYLSNVTTIFGLLKGENHDWFFLSNRWYLKPLEYFHLIKLAVQVIINVLLAFHPGWFIKEISWWLRGEKIDTE